MDNTEVRSIRIKREEAMSYALEQVMTRQHRMMFISITPWGNYEVSTHSVNLNIPIIRVFCTNFYRNDDNEANRVEVTQVSCWRRN